MFSTPMLPNDFLESTSQEKILKQIEILLNENKALRKTIIDLSVSNYESNINACCGILFSNYIKDWLRENKNRWEETTYDGYYSNVYKHIVPYFDEKKLDIGCLTSENILKYYNSRKILGLSENSIVKHHNNIKQCLDSAVKKGLIPSNPVTSEIRPKGEQFIGNHYTVSELEYLLKIAKNYDIYTPILLASFFGLRRSEILGLKWDCIDLKSGIVSIKRKAVRVSHMHSIKDNIQIKNKLKSQSSFRKLAIPQQLLEHLKVLKKQQCVDYMKNRKRYNKDYLGFICVNCYGNIISPTNLSRKFSIIIKENNLKKIRLHDLRHTCASILYKLGYDIKQIKDWLGHSDIKMTERYIHLYNDDKSIMANNLNNTISI